MKQTLVPIERIEKRIFFPRGEKVMLSTDLEEFDHLKSQIVISS